MIATAHDTSAPNSLRRSEPDEPTFASVVGGIAVGLSLQVFAFFCAFVAAVVVFAAAFTNFGVYDPNEQQSTWWIVFSIPMGLGALGLYILSGLAASKTMRSNAGWFVLATGPVLIASIGLF